MPRHRPPAEVWDRLRFIVWRRDGQQCRRCQTSVTFEAFHLDHIQSGKLASNKLKNLRVLCRRCHVLRADNRHRGMAASAIKAGIIPADWRGLVWEG